MAQNKDGKKKDVDFKKKQRGTTDEMEILRQIIEENAMLKQRVIEKIKAQPGMKEKLGLDKSKAAQKGKKPGAA